MYLKLMISIRFNHRLTYRIKGDIAKIDNKLRKRKKTNYKKSIHWLQEVHSAENWGTFNRKELTAVTTLWGICMMGMSENSVSNRPYVICWAKFDLCVDMKEKKLTVGDVAVLLTIIWRDPCKNPITAHNRFLAPHYLNWILRYRYCLYLTELLLEVKKNLMVFMKNKICSNNLLRFIAVLWHFVGWNASFPRLTC